MRMKLLQQQYIDRRLQRHLEGLKLPQSGKGLAMQDLLAALEAAERKRTGARPILRLASRMRVGVYFRSKGRTGEDLALLPYPSGGRLTSQRQRYELF